MKGRKKQPDLINPAAVILMAYSLIARLKHLRVSPTSFLLVLAEWLYFPSQISRMNSRC